MKKIFSLLTIAIVMLFAISANAAEYSSWGALTYSEEEELVFTSPIKYGVAVDRFFLFGEISIHQSTRSEDRWNNKIAPRLGIEYVLPVEPIKGANWQDYRLGFSVGHDIFTNGDEPEFVYRSYLNWGFGGSFNDDLMYSSWGSLAYTESEKLVLATELKQGVQLPSRFILYGKVGIHQSTQSKDKWNNKFAPRLGIEYVLPVEPIKGANWQDYRVGANAGYNIYTNGNEAEFTTLIYLVWGFGGSH